MRKGARAAMASVLTGGMLFLGVGATPADSDRHEQKAATEHHEVRIDVESTEVVVGAATSVDEHSMSVTTPSGTEVTVKWDGDTAFPDGDAETVDAGVIVAALGTMDDSGILRADVIFFPGAETAPAPGEAATAPDARDAAPAPNNPDAEAGTSEGGTEGEAGTSEGGTQGEASMSEGSSGEDTQSGDGGDAGTEGR